MSEKWSKWENLGKPSNVQFLRQLAVGRNLDGRQEVIATGETHSPGRNVLCHIWQVASNGAWSSWGDLGTGIETTGHDRHQRVLAVVPNADGRLEVFAIGGGKLRHVWQTAPNNGWSELDNFGSPAFRVDVVEVQVARNQNGAIQVVALGDDKDLWGRRQSMPNNGWDPWDCLGGGGHDRYVIGENADGRLDIITLLFGGTPAHFSQGEPNSGFNRGFGNMGISGEPIEAIAIERNHDGTLEVSAAKDDGTLVHLRQPVPGFGSASSGWNIRRLERPPGNIALNFPALARRVDGRLALFAIDSDGNLWHADQTQLSGEWGPWTNLRKAPTGAAFGFPVVGQNQDGRHEVYRIHGGDLWHIWEIK